LDELLEFWRLAWRLKKEPRRGWLRSVRVRKIESVADHSFGVAILALVEARRRGLDLGRVLRLALVHDLEEAITGDFTPVEKKRLTPRVVSMRRRWAVAWILAKLPEAQRKGFAGDWEELRVGGSREALLVKDLDKLEMAFQAREYERMGVAGSVSDFYRSARKGIKDKALRKELARALDRRD
jgi:putative hydrolases of HD superfamily